MPRSTSGTYSASASSFNPAVSGATIDPTVWNTLLADFTSTFTDSWSRSGKGAATANLSMGGFRLTNVAAAAAAADAMSRSASDIRYQQLNAKLTALASVSSSANRVPYFTSSTSASFFTSTVAGRALAGLAGAANTAPYFTSSSSASTYSLNAGARARNGVTVGVNSLVYNTTSTSAASTSFTSAARTFIAAASASAQTALLVVGKGATSSSAGTKGLVKAPSAGDQGKFYRGDQTWQTIAGGGDLLSTNNLSDVANAATAFGNIKQLATASTTGVAKLWTLAVITATTTSWAVPSGTKEMIIELWGGGGSGGGKGATSTATERGPGGASGTYGMKLYQGTMDATLNITIGSGGSAVTSAAGNSGNTTSVVGSNLGTVSVPGGGGGSRGSTGGAAGGSSGGSGTGCTISIPGQGGGVTWALTNQFGIGGSAPRGGPGGTTNVGTDGTVPGGGGSGENHAGGNSGAGARGEVWIWTH